MDPPPRPSPTLLALPSPASSVVREWTRRLTSMGTARWSVKLASLGCHPHHDMNHALLAFPADGNPAASVAIVCFNWAVWTERSQFLPTLGHTPSRSLIARRISSRARLRVPLGGKVPGKQGEEAVASFARAVPDGPAVAFTDGFFFFNTEFY